MVWTAPMFLNVTCALAVPALLEIAKEMVAGEAHEDILREAEEALIEEAMRVE